jgi:[ribosomal protein S18]-alanine N-acetyltransferase
VHAPRKSRPEPLPLRDYRPSDFRALWELDQACFSPEIAYTKAELQHFLDYPGSFTLIAEHDGVIHGFILTHVHQKHGHVITIDIRADQRRTGLGSHLLRAAEERLRALGKEAVALEVAVDNPAAITFYNRHGFTLVKTMPRYYNNGVDALRMAKALSPA